MHSSIAKKVSRMDDSSGEPIMEQEALQIADLSTKTTL